MALMQMEYPNIPDSWLEMEQEMEEPYYVSSFIAGFREGIKHYLIPHNPQSLCETYWKAKELEKCILVKKSLLSPNPQFTKPFQPYTSPTTKTQTPS
jgi:hypothetical protein